jgi:hypothetical protein
MLSGGRPSALAIRRRKRFREVRFRPLGCPHSCTVVDWDGSPCIIEYFRILLLVNKSRLHYKTFLSFIAIRIRKYPFVDGHCCLFSLLFPLLLAGRQMLMRSHPLQERRLAVANGATDFNERRPFAPHAGLGQPGEAYLERPSSLRRCKQDREARRGRLLMHSTVADRRLRNHVTSPLQLVVVRNFGPSRAKMGQAQQSITSTKGG